MKILLKNIHAVDPKNKLDHTVDVLIDKGRVVEISKNISCADAELYENASAILVPGLIDMHVHLREPGREDAETIESGCAAAARGGMTGVACMPNTEPCIDNAEVLSAVYQKAEKAACRVFPIATVTKGRQGKELAPLGELAEAGAHGFTDDGSPIMDSGLMRRALEYSRMFDKPIMPHEEDYAISLNGAMNEGPVSTRLGVPGWHRCAEELMMERDVRLVKYFGGSLHIQHVTTAGGVDIIRRAKADGLPVTAESAPHYWTIFDKDVNFNTHFKMNPPLRTQEDGAAIIEGLKDGTLDAIITDHAPHTEATKDLEFNLAPFGITGLETSLALVLTSLYHKQILSLEQIIEKMSYAQSHILGIDNQGIRKGAPAHLTLIDLNRVWTVRIEDFVSKSKNSPFVGWELTGRAIGTIVNGQWRFRIDD